MKGPGLLALFADLATGGSDETRRAEALVPGLRAGISLLVSDAEKKAAVDELLGN